MVISTDAFEQPIQAGSRRLWSLWDMLQKYAALFVSGTTALDEAKWIAFQTNAAGKDSPLARSQIVAVGRHGAGLIRQACILADMDSVLPQIDRLDQSFEMLLEKPAYNLDTVGHSIKHLISRIHDELDTEHFFRIDKGDVSFYVNKQPFGEVVSDKFPLASEDIEEASKCLALQQSTACIFHLMRAMEGAVKRLGERLGVKNVEKEWGKILSDIGGAIERMPNSTLDEKAARNNWSEVHANLYHVKQAWRNDTMHPKQTYSREEAYNVFVAMRVFMAHLVTLV